MDKIEIKVIQLQVLEGELTRWNNIFRLFASEPADSSTDDGTCRIQFNEGVEKSEGNQAIPRPCI